MFRSIYRKDFRLFVAILFFGMYLRNQVTMVYATGQGTSGAVVLAQSIGAKAGGMADTYASVDGDICALHYNPAGLVSLKEKQASFIYQRGVAEDNFGVINLGIPAGRGVFAGSFVYYTVGNIELIDISGNSRTVKGQQDYIVILILQPISEEKCFIWSER